LSSISPWQRTSSSIQASGLQCLLHT
jgi:hypothetical protein